MLKVIAAATLVVLAAAPAMAQTSGFMALSPPGYTAFSSPQGIIVSPNGGGVPPGYSSSPPPPTYVIPGMQMQPMMAPPPGPNPFVRNDWQRFMPGYHP
jgi:hypothetical protein